jgi:hypothetical protein
MHNDDPAKPRLQIPWSVRPFLLPAPPISPSSTLRLQKGNPSRRENPNVHKLPVPGATISLIDPNFPHRAILSLLAAARPYQGLTTIRSLKRKSGHMTLGRETCPARFRNAGHVFGMGCKAKLAGAGPAWGNLGVLRYLTCIKFGVGAQLWSGHMDERSEEERPVK